MLEACRRHNPMLKIDIGDYYGDFSKIKAALDWSLQISLEQGLAETFAYYNKHRAHYWNADA